MPNPCKNGGTCVRKGKKGYKCECLDPYFGKHCQKEHEGNLPFFQIGKKLISDCMHKFLSFIIVMNCSDVIFITSMVAIQKLCLELFKFGLVQM